MKFSYCIPKGEEDRGDRRESSGYAMFFWAWRVGVKMGKHNRRLSRMAVRSFDKDLAIIVYQNLEFLIWRHKDALNRVGNDLIVMK